MGEWETGRTGDNPITRNRQFTHSPICPLIWYFSDFAIRLSFNIRLPIRHPRYITNCMFCASVGESTNHRIENWRKENAKHGYP